jgi:hypothetical protein
MTLQLVISLGWPDRKLWPNRGLCKLHLSRLRAEQRESAKYAATCCVPHPPYWVFCTASLVGYAPDARHYDALNLAYAMKAAIDGLTDAGIWADDRYVTFIVPPVQNVDRRNPRVMVTVTTQAISATMQRVQAQIVSKTDIPPCRIDMREKP